LADLLNALMAVPSLIAVLMLSHVVVDETKRYINNIDDIDETPIPVVDK
jgi:AGCS family alanine or glycine:cation symporter